MFIILGLSAKRVRLRSEKLVSQIIKKGLSYNLITKLLLEMPGRHRNKDIKTIVKNSKLNKTYKDYFLKIIEELEKKKYSGKKETKSSIKIDKAAFKAVLQEISR